MAKIAIQVEGLSKQYFIGGKQERYQTFRDTLVEGTLAPFRKAAQLWRGQSSGAAGLYEPIWALKDASFDVCRGQVVGIIGRNGAGKSTLLKILSRITEPTHGFAKAYGRVGSLLEVGTGFHPELTGRENIYLNGSILGMKKQEINVKLDEIIAFAEVQRFIDTPVKHYSSGMYLRLAFSVAAHLNPEILLIDEILAVGDAVFQKKCLGKMQEISTTGRTVLYVSHNLNSLQMLCNQGILIREGKVVLQSEIENCVREYLEGQDVGPSEIHFKSDAEKEAQFLSVGLGGISNGTNCVRQDEGIEIWGTIIFRNVIHCCMTAISVWSAEGIPVFTTTDWDTQPQKKHEQKNPGLYQFNISIPGRFLFPGRYFLRLGLGVSGHFCFDQHASSIEFEVGHEGSIMVDLGDKRRGVVTYELDWKWSNRKKTHLPHESHMGSH